MDGNRIKAVRTYLLADLRLPRVSDNDLMGQVILLTRDLRKDRVKRTRLFDYRDPDKILVAENHSLTILFLYFGACGQDVYNKPSNCSKI